MDGNQRVTNRSRVSSAHVVQANMTPAPDDTLVSALSESEMYRDYERAFTRGTGLPLRLHEPAMMQVVHYDRKQENPFCALMAKTNQSCATPARERDRVRCRLPITV